MKIGIDGRSLLTPERTGIGVYLFELLARLPNELPEADIFILYTGSEETLKRAPALNPKIRVLKVETSNRLMRLLVALGTGPSLDNLAGETPDLWLIPNPALPCQIKAPYLTTVHDLSFVIAPEFFTRREILFHKLARTEERIKSACGVLAVSAATASDAKNVLAISDGRIVVTPLGVDSERFGDREQPSDRAFRAAYNLNRPYFLALGTEEPRKNHAAIVEAYANFIGKHPERDERLVFMGGRGWKRRHFERALKTYDLGDRLLTLGFVPEKHQAALIRGAVATIFPSFYEGFGLPVLESLSAGTPVIASFTPAVAEVADDAGLYVDPWNVGDMTAAMLLLTDPELRAHYANRAKGRATDFSWQKTAEATAKAIRQSLHK